MANGVRECDRYIVAHYCCGQRITNTVKTFAEAEQWWQFLQTLDRIEAAEIIGIVEEQHLLKGWKKEIDHG